MAAKSGFVNLHLLVSPEDPNHLAEVRRILTRLQFNAHGDRFDCTRGELIRLGKRADPTISDDRAALAHGATQFKVNFAQLREVFGESDWAKRNILIAVAGGADDGTSGVRQAADATVRQEIEKFSHIIFASSQAQREFWLGQRAVSIDELRARYNGCKPCLHGSDAHGQMSIGQPADDRSLGSRVRSLSTHCVKPASIRRPRFCRSRAAAPRFAVAGYFAGRHHLRALGGHADDSSQSRTGRYHRSARIGKNRFG